MSSIYSIYSVGWIGNDPLTVVIGESDPYVSISGQVCYVPLLDIIVSNILLSFLSSHNSSFYQEANHLHAAAVLMTIIMVIAFLISIAIVRRILIATSVLKVCMALNPLASHEYCFPR